MRVGPRRTAGGLLTALALLLSLTQASSSTAHAAENLALRKEVTASGQETTNWGPEKMVDGNPGPDDATPPSAHNEVSASRWSANQADHVWATVDFASLVEPSEVSIRWGNTFSTNYSLLGSTDGEDWTPLVTKAAGAKGQWATHAIHDAEAIRYLKLESFAKSQQWSLSVWELEVRGAVEGAVELPFTSTITPRPKHQQAGEQDDFILGRDTAFIAVDDAANVAESFAKRLRISTGYELPVKSSGTGIEFVLDPILPGSEEAYTLSSASDGVTITARTTNALRYGGHSLLQLLGAWSYSSETVVQEWAVPSVEIVDQPRYQWRGYMLDVARNFFTVEEVQQLIDQMAQFKLNVLHIHLSDDQGWRLAISNQGKDPDDPIDYSLLTSVSGSTAMAPTKWTTKQGTTGFYTAAQFRGLLAYAKEQGIALVPEIDMPGHTNAILHAIPQLNTAGSLPKLPKGQETAPSQLTSDVGESALDANAEITYTFIKHVVSQMIAEYPSEVHGETFFHIGGDETHKMNEQNPENYKTFMRRASDIIADLDATGIVWNEAASGAQSALADGFVIQHWSSMDGVADYVNNHDGRIIMSPASRAYLPQVPGDVLGPTWACSGACDLERFYVWDPTAAAGVAEEKVLGVEAPIWGEHLRSWKSAEYLTFPRLAATAEVGWTPQSERSFDEFSERVGFLGNLLTVQDRNFYPEDGNWQPEARTLFKEPVKEGDKIGDIAVASIPQVKVADVTASVTLNGRDYPLAISNSRDFHSGKAAMFDDRNAAGLFRFAVDKSLPKGTYSGEATIQWADKTVTTPISLVVQEGTQQNETPSTDPTKTAPMAANTPAKRASLPKTGA